MNRSTEALIWAMNARGLSQAGWRVLVTLARRVGKRGFDVWPKHKTLAAECEMGVSTVRRALAELETEGFVDIIARFDDQGDRTSNIYRLQVRTKMSYPSGVDVDLAPDDEDDDASIPSEAEKRGVRSNRAHPPAQIGQTVPPNRADPLLASGQAEHIQEEHIPVEDSPYGDTPPGDLLIPGLDEPVRSIDDFVLDGWHALKRDCPGIADVGVLTPARKKAISARAREVVSGRAKSGMIVTAEDVWIEIFAAVRSSTFLQGKAPPGKGRTSAFKLGLDFVLRQSQFNKILEGGYDDGPRSNRSFDAGTGREYGPSEQALRGSLDSLYASHQQ